MTRSLDDLIVLSRRGELSPAEARRLDVYLAASDDARLIHDIGSDYDGMHTDRSADAALLERVGRRVIERHARGSAPSPSRWRTAAVVGLGAILASTTAAAFGVYYLRPPSSAGAPATQRAAEQAQKVAAIASARSVELLPSPEVSPSAWVAPPDVPGRDRDEPSTRSPAPTTSTRPASGDARSLFSRANAERKAGNVGNALVAYAELRQRFPESPEALLSRVLCGRLLLARGDAESAAAEFAAYLAGSPNGTLAEEALHGRAQALRSLGRASEENETWRLLLERFPKSIHVKTARERLQRDP
jgi:TolA-binding protein